MRLLVDTHVVLAWLGGTGTVSALAERQLSDDSNRVLVSAVVLWEIAIKRSIGKLRTPDGLVAKILKSNVVKLAISLEHAAAVEHLPLHHRDPFDRLLIAQATIEGATLVSADDALRAYGVPIVW